MSDSARDPHPWLDPAGRRRGREQLVNLAQRSRQVLLLAGLTGVLVGALVAGFDWITRTLVFDSLVELPVAVQVLAPVTGLLLAAGCLRWLASGAPPATTDMFIRAYHDRDGDLDRRRVLGRLAASVSTLGLGGALGYEGPALYGGAATGSLLQSRLSRYFGREDSKVLMVAGAAAGVAAIFKAPATGVVFALEVPFQDDLARRMLLPASIAAAASYLTFVAFAGTTPLFAVAESPPFNFTDLGGAALVGALAGIGARLFSHLVTAAKRVAQEVPALVRALVAGSVLGILVVGSHHVYGEALSLGAGYRSLEWALDPDRTLALVLGLFALRAVATAVTLGGGGVGGLFIPLAVQGALLGRMMGGIFGLPESTLFPLIGLAAFLGAGYRTPLAAVMFVAEATGRPGFVVPGLIAAVLAQLFMGRASVSPYQVAARAGHLERRFELPVTSVLNTDVATAPSDSSIAELFWTHVLGSRQRSVPVVDGVDYRGMVHLGDLRGVDQDLWAETPVTEVMRRDLPVGRPDWYVRDVVQAMSAADTDQLVVLDGEDRFVGLVSTNDIIELDEILDETR